MLNYKELSPNGLEYIQVAETEELANGDRLFIEIDEHSIILFNIAGKYFAIGDVCSHDGEPLGEGGRDGEQIVCPRHGARFDLNNGEAVALPAVEDIPAYPVKVVAEHLEIGIPLRK